MHTTTRTRLRAAAAFAATLLVVAGTPLLLARLAGSPIPQRLPDLGRLRDALGGTLSSDELTNVLVALLALVCWCTWLVITTAVVGEALAAAQHRATRTVQQLGAVQHLARALIGPIALGIATLRPAVPGTAVGLPVRAPAITVTRNSSERAPARLQAEVTADVHVVAARETLLDIAESRLGDARRWRDIWQLNRGRVMSDGSRLERPEMLHAGWRLQLPAEARASCAEPLRAPSILTTSASPRADVYVVRPGDTLWDIVADRDHGNVTAAKVDEVFDANRGVTDWRGDHPLHDPNLINPGMHLNLAVLDEPPTGTPPTGTPPPVSTPPVTPPSRAPAPHSTSTTSTAPPTTTPSTTPAANGTAATTIATEPTTTPANRDRRAPDAGRPADSSRWLVGLGLLASSVVAAATALRRRALRTARPGDTTAPTSERVAQLDTQLHAAAAGYDARLAAAAAALGRYGPQAMQRHADGTIDVLLAAPSVKLPKPWRAASGGNLARLRPGDRLSPDATALAPTWVELGTTTEGGELYIDLAASRGLDLDASGEAFTCMARALTATLCAAPHGGALRLHVYGFDAHGVDPFERIEQHDTIDDLTRAVAQRDLDDTTIVITTTRIDALDDEDLIVVAPADDRPSTRWRLLVDERDSSAWTVEPLGLAVSPSGLASDELAELAAYYEHAATDIICDPDDDTPADRNDPRAATDDAPHWAVMVRLLGPVEVTNPAGEVATLRRKPLEALVWLVEHRAHASRTSLENGLWTAEVSPDTLQNAISEARRALRSLATPPEGEEWLPRTMRLHSAIVSDAELVSAAIKQAAGQDDATAVATLEGAVALLRGAPLSDVSYVWADAESVPSRLTLLGVRAAAELAMRYLALGDSDGALHATAIGLTVLPGHEQLVCLRMQAHAARHDLVSLRGEYETYERTVVADDFADGEVSPEVAATYRRLVEHARMRPAS